MSVDRAEKELGMYAYEIFDSGDCDLIDRYTALVYDLTVEQARRVRIQVCGAEWDPALARKNHEAVEIYICARRSDEKLRAEKDRVQSHRDALAKARREWLYLSGQRQRPESYYRATPLNKDWHWRRKYGV